MMKNAGLHSYCCSHILRSNISQLLLHAVFPINVLTGCNFPPFCHCIVIMTSAPLLLSLLSKSIFKAVENCRTEMPFFFSVSPMPCIACIYTSANDKAICINMKTTFCWQLIFLLVIYHEYTALTEILKFFCCRDQSNWYSSHPFSAGWRNSLSLTTHQNIRSSPKT